MQANLAILTVIPPSPRTARGQSCFLDSSAHYLAYFNNTIVILYPLTADHHVQIIRHTSEVSAIRFNHNGNLIASIDDKGCLLIHEIFPKELILHQKFNNFYIGAKALDWTFDSNKICVVGAGKNSFGRVFNLSAQANVGEINGVSAKLNTCHFRPMAPYKLVVGGDQSSVKLFQGPPYKFRKSKKGHNGYINQLKFNTKGNLLVSVGADRKIVVYEGDDLQIKCQKQGAHGGGIFGVDWVDQDRFITVSSDKTAKVWSSTLDQLEVITINTEKASKNPKAIGLFQVGVTTRNGVLFTVSLSGEIRKAQIQNKLNKLQSFYVGVKNKIIGAQFISHEELLILGSDGNVVLYNCESQKSTLIELDIQITLILDYFWKNNCLYILSGNGSIHAFDGSFKTIISVNDAQARFISYCYEENAFVSINNNKISKFKNAKLFAANSINEDPACLTSSREFAFYGGIKGNIYVFDLNSMEKILVFKNTSNKVSALWLREQLLVSGDSMGILKVWKAKGKQAQMVSDAMGNHNSLISKIMGREKLIYTLSMDGKVNIWDANSYKRIHQEKAMHVDGVTGGSLEAVDLKGKGRVVTFGGDLLLKVWRT